jgi:AraC-like DNA-binding protein
MLGDQPQRISNPSQWNDQQHRWYFSIVDVIAILTGSPNPRKYWSVHKTRLKKEGSQLATNCSQLKMQSSNLTAEISKATFGLAPSEYKNLKGLTKSSENLRDHMTDLELIFSMPGEASTAEIARNKNAHGFKKI